MTDPLKTLQKIRRLCRRVEQTTKNKSKGPTRGDHLVHYIRVLAANGVPSALVQDEVSNKQAHLKAIFLELAARRDQIDSLIGAVLAADQILEKPAQNLDDDSIVTD